MKRKVKLTKPIQMPTAQRGAALVVGLIMLLLLTLVGVAGMKDTLLQQKMVANAKDRDAALQAAESALRAAGEDLIKPSKLTMTGTGGLYIVAGTIPSQLVRTKNEAAFWQQWDWANNSVAYNFSLSGVNAGSPPRFVVEELPKGSAISGGGGGGSSSGVVAEDWRGDDGGCKDDCGGVDYTQYRVTARGVGTSTDAVVILQATYRRSD